jgi:hypothetical protein
MGGGGGGNKKKRTVEKEMISMTTTTTTVERIIHIVLLFFILALVLASSFYKNPWQRAIDECMEEVLTSSVENRPCFEDPEICGEHGNCGVNGHCNCTDPCWGGIYCNVTCDPESIPVCCDLGGTDKSWYGECKCKDGWYGDFCEYQCTCPIDYELACVNSTQCEGKGECVNGVCICPDPHFTGVNCEYEADLLISCWEDEDCVGKWTHDIMTPTVCVSGICFYNNE